MQKPASLAISIVTYAPVLDLVEQTLSSLNLALGYARRYGVVGQTSLFLVDNGPGEVWQEDLHGLLARGGNLTEIDTLELLSGHGNVGYGAGHNLAIRRADADFHLVLNPDVLLEQESLLQALTFMELHPDIGLLAPAAVDSKGNTQYLCKRYPSVLNLLLRGFAPPALKKIFRKYLDDYELRDVIDDTVIWDIPIVSGCFMLLRRSVLFQVQGFSSAYFLYFEDFDLSLRVARVARIAYAPKVRITHYGGYAAQKGWRHIGMFLCSAVTFFNRHGWKWR